MKRSHLHCNNLLWIPLVYFNSHLIEIAPSGQNTAVSLMKLSSLEGKVGTKMQASTHCGLVQYSFCYLFFPTPKHIFSPWSLMFFSSHQIMSYWGYSSKYVPSLVKYFYCLNFDQLLTAIWPLTNFAFIGMIMLTYWFNSLAAISLTRAEEKKELWTIKRNIDSQMSILLYALKIMLLFLETF